VWKASGCPAVHLAAGILFLPPDSKKLPSMRGYAIQPEFSSGHDFANPINHRQILRVPAVNPQGLLIL